MKTLVIGASGATGKLLVDQLLETGQSVKAIVRPESNVPIHWINNEKVDLIRENINEVSAEVMAEYLSDCNAAASCLGHSLTFKGIFGKPRRLVSDAVRLISKAIRNGALSKPFRFVLMNTAGNSNRGLNEQVSLPQKFVIGMIRLFLPPHADNENASDQLRLKVGQSDCYLEWVVVRPDTLINEANVSEYSVHPSPLRSAVFNPGRVSRINVAHFMAKLVTDDKTWNEWKGQMPVIYNL